MQQKIDKHWQGVPKLDEIQTVVEDGLGKILFGWKKSLYFETRFI